MRTRMVAVFVALACVSVLIAPAAQAQPVPTSEQASMSFALPVTTSVASLATLNRTLSDGTKVWTSLVLVGQQPVPMLNVRYSWKRMWAIRNHGWLGAASEKSILCTFLIDGRAIAVCTAVVLATGYAIYKFAMQAFAVKKCLQMRMSLPPYPPFYGTAKYSVRCTI